MPYIEKNLRDMFADAIRQIHSKMIINKPGELNYLITSLCQVYLKMNGESYKTYNDIIGVLECAKLEMYRRAVSIYEDKKIKENGDVYQ